MCKQKQICANYDLNKCNTLGLLSCANYKTKEGCKHKLGFTRSQYMSNEVTHEEYYAQFINDNIKKSVLACISINDLLNSNDKNLNDIPLKIWDCLSFNFDDRMKELEGGYSLSFKVCVCKAAAREIIKENKKDN